LIILDYPFFWCGYLTEVVTLVELVVETFGEGVGVVAVGVGDEGFR